MANQLKVSNVLGDGNCFYRSLSVSLYGHQDCHIALRTSIADHIRSQVAAALPEERNALLQQADVTAKNGVWATKDTIISAAELLRLNIKVYIAALQSSPLCYSPSLPVMDPRPLLLAFYEPGHFCPVATTSASTMDKPGNNAALSGFSEPPQLPRASLNV